MANQFARLNVKPAIKARSEMKYPYDCLATFDFGQVLPLLSAEILPSDTRWNGDYKIFSRMQPLVKPTYGRFSFHTMQCFVPLYQIADDAEACLAGKTTWEGEVPALRYIKMSTYAETLAYLSTPISSTGLTDDGKGYLVDSGGNRISKYDWKYTDANGNIVYCDFRNYKYYIKLLNALGYALPQKPDLRSTSTWYQSIGAKTISAMPLLAFLKAYNDWMSQSTRYNTSSLTDFLRCVRHNKSTTGYNYSSHLILQSGLLQILSAINVIYENDYFLSAWQQPNCPLASMESISSMSVPGPVNADVVVSSVTNNYIRQNVNGGQIFNSKRALDFLKSFDDWVRRNNYSGSRAVQQIYSRFGVKTEDYRSNYAHVLKTDVYPVQVGDITSMAETNGAILGDYAGKGILSADGHIEFEPNDYGYLFIFGWYTLNPLNPYGFDKSVLRVDPMDFYNPEFDGLGAEAISFMEIFENPIAAGGDLSTSDSVYGFTERYNSYRTLRSKIIGDFRDYHVDGEMNTWHAGRLLNDIRKDGVLLAQHPAMERVSTSEWNRFFANIDSSMDHFFTILAGNFNASRGMMNLNEVPQLGVGNLSVAKNGNEIN